MTKTQIKLKAQMEKTLRDYKWSTSEIAAYMIAQRHSGLLAKVRTTWEVKNGIESWAITGPRETVPAEYLHQFPIGS